MGMKGYVIIVTEDMEYAWINWDSLANAKRAYGSDFGINVVNEASEMMRTIQWTRTTFFKDNLFRNKAYFVKIK